VISPPRAQLIAAAASVHAERGYVEMSIDQIVARAGLPREAFFEHFAGKLDCLAALQEEAGHALRSRVESAWASSPEWPERVAASVLAVLDFAAGDPQLIAALLPTSLLVEPDLAARIWAVNDCFAEALRSGRSECPQAGELPEGLEDVLVGGAQSLIAGHVRAGRAAELPAISPDLTQALLLPYLGFERTLQFVRGRPEADR
jgi:AcrR family transcriptional regulator